MTQRGNLKRAGRRVAAIRDAGLDIPPQDEAVAVLLCHFTPLDNSSLRDADLRLARSSLSWLYATRMRLVLDHPAVTRVWQPSQIRLWQSGQYLLTGFVNHDLVAINASRSTPVAPFAFEIESLENLASRMRELLGEPPQESSKQSNADPGRRPAPKRRR